MFFFFFVWSLIPLSQTQDPIISRLVYLNESVDPCDNFYRYVCPIEKVGEDLVILDDSFTIDETSVRKQLRLESSEFDDFFGADGNILKMKESLNLAARFVAAVDYIEQNDRTVGNLKVLLDDIRFEFLSMLDNTPWVNNYNVLEELKTLAENLTFTEFNSTESREEIIDTVITNLQNYKQCMMEIDNEKDLIECGNIIEVIMRPVLNFYNFDDYASMAESVSNSTITINARTVYLAKHMTTIPSLEGLVGFTMAHEFAHLLFLTQSDSELHGVKFSEQSRHCVNNQFQKLCDVYKEENCWAGDDYLEENGADILGLHLAYNVFKRKIGKHLQKIAYRTSFTNQQLFFISQAKFFCRHGLVNTFKTDPHSADNIRGNIVVQLPEFQQAFNCPSSSRMIQTRTEQCYIYGVDAPANRRKKLLSVEKLLP